jgi:hypothetical protein
MRALSLATLEVLAIMAAACGSSNESSPAAMHSDAAGGDDGSSGSSGSGGSSGTTSGGSSGGSTSGSGNDSGTSSGSTDGAAPADGGSSSGAEAGPCTDTCPVDGGVPVGCEKRFAYGVNYAWKNWVADFGGVSAWGQKGVSQNQTAIQTDLQDMQSHGVDVVRWWMLQKLEGDAVQFDGTGTPTGTGGTLTADIQAALSIAAQVGVHYNFTIFSFDDFAPNGTDNGATVHGMNPIITDTAKRAALMSVIATVAQTVESSPHKDRVASWDVINEPEWAITGSDPYGDMAFSPNTNDQPVTFTQMETFVSDAVKTLHAHSSAPVTVGGAAIKWAQAWSHVGLDFYTFHMYDWVNQYFPYDSSLASYGVTGKPTVMGEFPLAGLAAVNGKPAASLATMLGTFWTIGYAGAMPWAVDDTCCGSWSTAKASMQSFASMHMCQTRY